MKAVVYMQVDDTNNSQLLDKINELGCSATHMLVVTGFMVYQVEMTQEELIVLKLSVPFLQVDGLRVVK